MNNEVGAQFFVKSREIGQFALPQFILANSSVFEFHQIEASWNGCHKAKMVCVTKMYTISYVAQI